MYQKEQKILYALCEHFQKWNSRAVITLKDTKSEFSVEPNPHFETLMKAVVIKEQK
jgi:hypothetical protein